MKGLIEFRPLAALEILMFFRGKSVNFVMTFSLVAISRNIKPNPIATAMQTWGYNENQRAEDKRLLRKTLRVHNAGRNAEKRFCFAKRGNERGAGETRKGDWKWLNPKMKQSEK